MYIHEKKEWPNFNWEQDKVLKLLAEVRHFQGRLLGRMDALGFQLREEATLQTLTQEVLKTCEIEGEKLDTEQVRSSIAKHLGLDIGGPLRINRNVEGIVEIMLDATRKYNEPLDKERLWAWHAALFPTGRSGMHLINVGDWRNEASGPMQVVSGAYGREKVHYEAPSYDRLGVEMDRFIEWFNAKNEMDLVVKSAIAHFWFVTVHPFDDGNGRIARAIADMMLARSEQTTQRFYSLSSQIQHERSTYYHVLEKCQKGNMDITLWIEWFLNCLNERLLRHKQHLNQFSLKHVSGKHTPVNH